MSASTPADVVLKEGVSTELDLETEGDTYHISLDFKKTELSMLISSLVGAYVWPITTSQDALVQTNPKWAVFDNLYEVATFLVRAFRQNRVKVEVLETNDLQLQFILKADERVLNFPLKILKKDLDKGELIKKYERTIKSLKPLLFAAMDPGHCGKLLYLKYGSFSTTSSSFVDFTYVTASFKMPFDGIFKWNLEMTGIYYNNGPHLLNFRILIKHKVDSHIDYMPDEYGYPKTMYSSINYADGLCLNDSISLPKGEYTFSVQVASPSGGTFQWGSSYGFVQVSAQMMPKRLSPEAWRSNISTYKQPFDQYLCAYNQTFLPDNFKAVIRVAFTNGSTYSYLGIGIAPGKTLTGSNKMVARGGNDYGFYCNGYAYSKGSGKSLRGNLVTNDRITLTKWDTVLKVAVNDQKVGSIAEDVIKSSYYLVASSYYFGDEIEIISVEELLTDPK